LRFRFEGLACQRGSSHSGTYGHLKHSLQEFCAWWYDELRGNLR
jgi:hypothetical protein